MSKILTITLLFTLLALPAQKSPLSARLLEAPRVADDLITEASGVAPSHLNPGIFWTHNDSGDSARIFAVGADGSARGRFTLSGCRPTDVEDIASGPGPVKNQSYLYLADIGDNGLRREIKKIYRCPEPLISAPGGSPVIKEYDTIRFRYPGQRKFDAETLLLDPLTRDLYIVTKRGKKSRQSADSVFCLPWPQKTGELLTARPAGAIEVATGFLIGYGITGGDVSADGTQLIFKTYTNIYYQEREPHAPFTDFFKQPFINLPYTSQEGQGEAVCFTLDGNSYRTIAEESLAEAYLTLYQLRKPARKKND